MSIPLVKRSRGGSNKDQTTQDRTLKKIGLRKSVTTNKQNQKQTRDVHNRTTQFHHQKLLLIIIAVIKILSQFLSTPTGKMRQLYTRFFHLPVQTRFRHRPFLKSWNTRLRCSWKTIFLKMHLEADLFTSEHHLFT